MKNHLWKVPVFCLAAGLISYYATTFLGGHFFIVTGADNEVHIDEVRAAIWYGLIFGLALLAGWRCFRDVPRKALLCSALVWMGVLMVLFVAERWAPIGFWTAFVWNWSAFVPITLFKITGWHWPAGLVDCFVPLVFVLFGKKE